MFVPATPDIIALTKHQSYMTAVSIFKSGSGGEECLLLGFGGAIILNEFRILQSFDSTIQQEKIFAWQTNSTKVCSNFFSKHCP
jgi:hypothetical protein